MSDKSENDIIKQNKALIEALKPLAFTRPNKRIDGINWVDRFHAQKLLLSIMGAQEYLKEEKRWPTIS